MLGEAAAGDLIWETGDIADMEGLQSFGTEISPRDKADASLVGQKVCNRRRRPRVLISGFELTHSGLDVGHMLRMKLRFPRPGKLADSFEGSDAKRPTARTFFRARGENRR